MKRSAYRDEIKLKLTGNLLDFELDDPTLDKILDSALRELQRYVCSTELITIPFEKCIDMSKVKNKSGKKIKVSSVSHVYRADGFVADSAGTTGVTDPMYASQWQLLSGVGNMNHFQDYMLNYMSWNTLLQIRNTTSTDMAFMYDKASDKLYINVASGNPKSVTVLYVPRFDTPEDVVSDYWIDVLVRLAVAITKITVGRIRSKFTQSNSLWTLDGQTLLDEGKTELTELRQTLAQNAQLVYVSD